MRERCQHHAGDMRRGLLHVACHGEGVIVGITRHTDDQVDVRRAQHLVGLIGRRYLRECRRVTHTQFYVLIENLFIDAPVVLQHEGVVGVGYNEHVEDTFRHQIDKRHVLQEEIIKLLRNVLAHNVYFVTFAYKGTIK